jgi:hypothetical protein
MDPTLFVLLLGAVGGGAGILGMVVRAGRATAQRRVAVWAEAARRLAAGFLPGSEGSLFSSGRSMRIVATLEGVEVCIDCHTVSEGRSSTTYTRVSALAQAPAEFTLRIFEETLLSTLGKKLGTQDVVVGDPRFDEIFVVKSSDEEMARAWLVPGVTSFISRLSWSHDLAGGRVTSTCPEIVEDVHELVHAAWTTARLAGRGAALRAEWELLAQHLGGVLRGDLWRDSAPAIEVGGPTSPVCVELARAELPKHPRRIATRVRAARGGGTGERFVAAPRSDLTDRDGEIVPASKTHKLELRSRDPRATAARFDDEGRHALDALDASAVVATETEVAVLFAGIMLDEERLHAAIAALRRLASTESSRPYR